MTRTTRLTLLAAAALLANACAEANADPKPGPAAASASPLRVEATRVEVATIDQSEATLGFNLPAEVEAGREATLASAQGGPVESVLVKEGDQVEKGQLLVRVDAATYQIQIEQVGVEIDQAKRELARAVALGDAIASAERERLETQVKLLEMRKKMNSLHLGRAVVRAPFGGTVASVDVEVGEVVSPAHPLVRLVQLDPIKVVLSVPDRDVPALQEGAQLQVIITADPEPRAGVISRILPAGSQQTRTFRAEIDLDNPDQRLRPGMIAAVIATRKLAEGAVVLPQSYLVTRRDAIGVYVEDANVARWHSVKVGQIVRDQVTVVDGLVPGESVVVNGHRLLADGDHLIVARRGRCCTNGHAVFE